MSKELKKTGEDYRTKFDDTRNKKISYQTKEEDKVQNKPKVIPIQEANKNLQNELQEIDEAYDKWKIANYENNVARVNNEESTLFDKTIGTPIRAVKDLLSPLTTGDDNTIVDEKGNKTFLPSYNELKQQKVRQDTKGIGGIAQDIGYNATKVLGATALDAVTGGMGGKALYWTDMAEDNYKNIKNQGYSNEQAIANTIVSTGTEFLTEKLLGGLSKELTGGSVSQLDDAISSSVGKFISNPQVASVIGSMGSEGVEEFTQEWLGALNNKITLGEDADIDKLVQDSLYSALVGAGSGGLVRTTGKINQANSIKQPQIQQNLAQNTTTQPSNTNTQINQNASQIAENAPINESQINQQQVQSSPDVVQPSVERNATNQQMQFNLDNTENTQSSAENLAEEKAKETVLKFTPENIKDTSKQIAKELTDTFQLKKGEAYSRTPQTAVEAFKAYENAPKITDFSRETVIHEIATDKAAKTDASTKYKEIGTLDENVAYAKGMLTSGKVPTKNDKALVIHTINEALSQGRTDLADELVSDLTVLDTAAGQWTQASKLMKQMTPLGQLQTFQKMVQHSIDSGNPRFKNVKITQDMINRVLDCYDSDGNFDNNKFADNMEYFKEEIQSQMTPTTMDKFNSVRMLGMLGAPKTHIRNMLANVGGVGLRVVKNINDRVAESVFVRDQSKRTRTFRPATSEIKSYVNEVVKSEKDTISGNKYSSGKLDLQSNLKTFNENHKGMAKIVNPLSKLMNKLSSGNSWALEAEDTLFSSFAYKRSLQEFLTAQGMKTKQDIENNPKILEKGKDFALQQALEATYRQDSNLASAISNYVKKAESPNASKFDKVGGVLVEANLPFKKTPINVAKTGIEYSPVGLVNGIYDALANVKSGKVEISQAIDEISKGITGLGLLGVGALLAHNGFEIISSDDDKDKKATYDKLLGESEYSVKVGDTYYDLSWMSPSSMPFFTGVELYQALTKNKKMDGNTVIDTISKTIDPLSSMSFLQGLSYTMQSYANNPGEFFSTLGMSSIESYVSQYIPTILSQIANVTDEKQRSTSVAGDSTFNERDKLINQIKYKIPGKRQELPERTDSWGRTLKNENYGNLFNAFINPSNTKKDLKNKTDKELENLYYSLGEDNDLASSVLPKVKFDKYLTFNKEKYNLSNKELTEFKKTYGDIARKNVEKLVETDSYKKATDEEKAKFLKNIYDYSNQKAKEKYGIKKGLDYEDYKLDQLYALVDAFDIPLETAVTNKSVAQLKAENGVSGNKRKLAAIDNIDELDEIQKDALKRKFTMFMGKPNYKKKADGTDVGYALVEALEDSDVSDEKIKQIKKFLDLG